jgi:hypothetical protein
MIYIVEAHVSIYHGSWLVMDIPKHLTWISDPTIIFVFSDQYKQKAMRQQAMPHRS